MFPLPGIIDFLINSNCLVYSITLGMSKNAKTHLSDSELEVKDIPKNTHNFNLLIEQCWLKVGKCIHNL